MKMRMMLMMKKGAGKMMKKMPSIALSHPDVVEVVVVAVAAVVAAVVDVDAVEKCRL